MKATTLLTAATLILLHSVPVFGQEEPDSAPQEPAPATENAATPEKAPPKAKAAAVTTDGLRLAGFPMNVLQFEPALAAAFNLTPEQVQELKKASDETIEQTKKDQAANPDKKQVQKALNLAKKDFESRRGQILSGQQISLITTIQTTLRSSQGELKGKKGGPVGSKADLKVIFLKNLKSALNPEQIALLEAAGGKLP